MARRALAGGTTLILVIAALAGAAGAIDQPVAGKQLTLRRSAGGGALTLVLRDPAIPIPAPGSADDPSLAGLTVTLFGRASGDQATLFASAGLGRPGWKVRSAPLVTYTFANPTVPPGGAQLQAVVLRDGSGLRLRAKSAGLALAAPEGAVAVRVEWNSVRVCALFDGTAVRRDQDGRFIARDADAAGLADCEDDTLAAVPCGASATCGGVCPGDETCGGDPINGCSCISPHQPCGGTAPVCNGECPAGEECSNIGGVPFPSCGCLPTGSTGCGTVYPSCGDGDCPTGTSCFPQTFICCGDVTIDGCACLSEPPPEPCPGGCPTGWSCVGPAPGFPATCLPPFCNDGPGAPVCDGTCTLPGTQCTTISGICLCLDPCIGADPYPTCGGTCANAAFTCRGVDGQCVCIP